MMRFWLAALLAHGITLAAVTTPPKPAAKRPAAAGAKKPASSAEFDQLAKDATAAREQSRVDDAIELYRKAVKLKPAWNEGWWWLGSLLYDSDRYADARDAFKRVVSLDPKMGPGFAFLGLCEFQTKEYDAAIAHLERARELGLGDNEQLNNVAAYHDAMLLTRYERYEIAGRLLSELARRTDCSPGIVEATGLAVMRRPMLPTELPQDQRELIVKAGRAACLAGNRRGPEAQKIFEELAAEYPKEVNLHYAFGSFLLATDPDAAVSEFKKALELDPKHLPTLVSICFEYLKRGEAQTAVGYAQKAVEYGPKLFVTHASLGRALVDAGELDKGIKELESAVIMAPDSPQTRIALASAYSKAGRKEDAAKQRAEFLKLKKQVNDPGLGQ
jgi:tetratricopeptide (TPR) repeat protein